MNEKEQELKNEDLTGVYAEICGVGNTVRRVNVVGRDRIHRKIQALNAPSELKSILALFATAYMDGDSKQTVLRKLAMRTVVSNANADLICGLSCLEWYGDVVA